MWRMIGLYPGRTPVFAPAATNTRRSTGAGADSTRVDHPTTRSATTPGKGSLQHLSDIPHLRDIDVGFVHAGAPIHAKQRNLCPNAAGTVSNLRAAATPTLRAYRSQARATGMTAEIPGWPHFQTARERLAGEALFQLFLFRERQQSMAG